MLLTTSKTLTGRSSQFRLFVSRIPVSNINSFLCRNTQICYRWNQSATIYTTKLTRNSLVAGRSNWLSSLGRRLNSTTTSKPPALNSNGAKSIVGKPIGRKSKKAELRRLFALAYDEKKAILAAIGCLVVSSSISMCVPFSIGRIMDIITTESMSGQRIADFCLILFGLFLVGAVANFGRIYLINGAGKARQRIQKFLFQKCLF